MKYLAVFDDNMIRSLRREDDGLTIVLYDEDGNIRQTRLKPLQRYVLTMPNGESVYLTEDHIQALKEYERKKMSEELSPKKSIINAEAEEVTDEENN